MAGSLRVLISDQDPDSRVAARKALLRAGLEVASEAGYGTEAVAASLETKPDIVLISVEEPSARPLETAEALANALPDTPIIIYSSIDSADAVRQAMIFGASDYLVKPITAETVNTAVFRSLEQEERRQMRRAGQLSSDMGRGTVITIAGAKGGVGKSMLAVNLAGALKRETGKSVAIIDADAHFGDVATMMDLSPVITVADMLRDIGGIDRSSIRDYKTSHASGVDVFAGALEEEPWLDCAPEKIDAIIDSLAQVYEFVVVDTAGSFDPFVRHWISASTLSLVVTSGEVASIRATGAAFRRLEEGFDAGRVRAVLNRSSGARGVHASEVAQAIGQEIFWDIPHDRALLTAGQEGIPIVLSDGRSRAGDSISALARRIAGTTTTLTDEPQSVSIWKRLISPRGQEHDSSDSTVQQPARETEPRSS